MINQKAKLRRKADRLWFEKCLEKHGNKCELCGSDYLTQSHHFNFKGAYPKDRYCLENGIILCQSCHSRFHWRSEGRDRKGLEDKIEKIKGKVWAKKRREVRKKEDKNPSRSFETIKYYENVIKNLSSL